MPAKLPAIKDVYRYGAKWKMWWSSLQPSWRTNEGGQWPLDRTLTAEEAAEKGDWGRLQVVGRNGVFVLVLSIAWWLRATDGMPDEDCGHAIEDILWVFETLLRTCKRSRSPSIGAEAPAPKRRRTTRSK